MIRGDGMDGVLIGFIGSVLIVISLVMPMTFALVKNLLEQVNLLIDKNPDKKISHKENIDCIVMYYYYVSFLMEALVLYGVFVVLIFTVALLENNELLPVKQECIFYLLTYVYWIVMTAFVTREITRRKERIHIHKNKTIITSLFLSVLVILSTVIFLKVSDEKEYIWRFIMFAIVPIYLFVWVVLGWIWTPVSRLLKMYDY